MIYLADFGGSRYIRTNGTKSKVLKFGFVLLQEIVKFIHSLGII